MSTQTAQMNIKSTPFLSANYQKEITITRVINKLLLNGLKKRSICLRTYHFGKSSSCKLRLSTASFGGHLCFLYPDRSQGGTAARQQSIMGLVVLKCAVGNCVCVYLNYISQHFVEMHFYSMSIGIGFFFSVVII